MALVKVNVGHVVNFAIIYLDVNGNPMLTAPTPDSAPTWSNIDNAVETLAPASNGLTAVATPIAPGDDTVNLTLIVGGQSFSASQAIEVDAAPQVLGSVQISATVV